MNTESNTLETARTFHSVLPLPDSIAWKEYEESIKAVTERFRSHVAKAIEERYEARRQLANLIAAEDRYVKESGMRLDDPVSDAVEKARAVLSANGKENA